MRKTKLTKLTIDRGRWANGGNTGRPAVGTTMLLNEQGNMCCLGFACNAAGVPKDHLKGLGIPSQLIRSLHSLALDQIASIEYEAISLNDSPDAHPMTREAQLKRLFSRVGIELKFEGSSRKLK